MSDEPVWRTTSGAVSRRLFIAGTGSILAGAALAGRAAAAAPRTAGATIADAARVPALVIGSGYGGQVDRAAARAGGHRRAAGRNGHGLGHARLRRQDLRQHDHARPALVLAAHQDEAAAVQLPRVPDRQGHPEVHRHPRRRGVRRHHRLPGPRGRRRLAGQRRHGRHAEAGELRRDPPDGQRRRDVQHLLPARQLRARRRASSTRPGSTPPSATSTRGSAGSRPSGPGSRSSSCRTCTTGTT